MPLEAVWSVWTTASPSPGHFGVAAQGDRLSLSACYRRSSLDCTTCHNPHVSVYHEDRPADLFRLPCLGCHASDDCTGPARARATTSPADDCAACHMRRAEPHDQRGTLYTDHWIRANPSIDVHETNRCELEPLLPEAPGDTEPGERAYYRARAWLALTRGEDDHPCIEALDRALDALARAAEQGFDPPEARALLAPRREDGS